MSLRAGNVWAAAPTTSRGQPTVLAADAKGERLAYATSRSILLRNIDRPSECTQYTGHTAATTVARFAPSGYYCASGDVTGTVRVWDCSKDGNGSTKGEYPIVSGRINDLAWDGDSQRIIAVGDGKQRFGHCITADSGNTVGEISGHTSQINCVALRQQRPLRAATAGDDTSTVFYHGVPFKFNTSLNRHQRYVYGLEFSPDGSHLLSVGADRRIFLYDGRTGEAKAEVGNSQHTGSIFGASWAPDSHRFVTCSADQTVKTWDVETGQAVQSWRFNDETSHTDHQVGVVWPQGRSDGLIVALNLAGDLSYLQEGNPKVTKVVQGHQKIITSMVKADKTLYTGDSSGRVCAWDTSSGSAVRTQGPGHTNLVAGLAHKSAAPKSAVASVGWDDSFRQIDIDSGKFVGTTALDGQPRGIAQFDHGYVIITHKGIFLSPGATMLTSEKSPVAVAAAGTLVAVGFDDNSVSLYKLGGSQLELQNSLSFPSVVSCLSFDSTHQLAIGFSSGKILVFSSRDFSAPSITRWSAHTGRVSSIAWNATGTAAVSGGLDTNIFVWSVEKPGNRIKMPAAHADGVRQVAWLSESWVVSAGADACVKTWQVDNLAL